MSRFAYLESAVDVPEVEPGSGAGHDVAGQLVDRHRRHGAGVARQVLHVAVPVQLVSDIRPKFLMGPV